MTEVEGSIVRHIHRLTMSYIIYLIHCDVINVGVFCFRYVHEGIRYFNWFIVLTFEFCACCWRYDVFLLKDRSRIDVESTVNYCSLSRASFVAFPCVYAASLRFCVPNCMARLKA